MKKHDKTFSMRCVQSLLLSLSGGQFRQIFFFPSFSLSLSISPVILLSLPLFCCFEVLCVSHSQTAFLPCAELWPGSDREGPNADMLLITPVCVCVCVASHVHNHQFPSLFTSNYTMSCLLLSLPTPCYSWIILEMYFNILSMPYSSLFFQGWLYYDDP